MDKQLSGGPQEWDRPTYKVRGANIMPDKETGIGNWSEAEWRAARPDHALWLLQGLHRERSSPFALPVSPNVVDPGYCSPRKQAFDAAATRNNLRSCPLRATSISPTGSPPARGNGSEIAQRSKKLAIAVAKDRSRLHASRAVRDGSTRTQPPRTSPWN